jgi:hypothetical protein
LTNVEPQIAPAYPSIFFIKLLEFAVSGPLSFGKRSIRNIFGQHGLKELPEKQARMFLNIVLTLSVFIAEFLP